MTVTNTVSPFLHSNIGLRRLCGNGRVTCASPRARPDARWEYSPVTDAREGVRFVRVLGPVQVVLASGRVVDVPSVSQRRLLAILALHARTSVRAEWLADTLGVSTGALRTTVSRLRKALGDVVQTASTGYRLDVDVDAEMFGQAIADAAAGSEKIDALERALARWAGA